MSINKYFLRESDNMTHRKNTKANKPVELSQEASEEANAGANVEVSILEPALREAFSEIMANISKIIDEKLGPLSQLLQVQRERA